MATSVSCVGTFNIVNLFASFERAKRAHLIIGQYIGSDDLKLYEKGELSTFYIEMKNNLDAEKTNKVVLNLFLESFITHDLQSQVIRGFFTPLAHCLKPQLLAAVERGEEGAAQLFLESGVKSTKEILTVAMRKKCSEKLIENILKAGVKLNHEVAELAVQLNYLTVVKAFYHSKNQPSVTVFEVACKNQAKEICDYFSTIRVKVEGVEANVSSKGDGDFLFAVQSSGWKGVTNDKNF